jgi:hypothetical protein
MKKCIFIVLVFFMTQVVALEEGEKEAATPVAFFQGLAEAQIYGNSEYVNGFKLHKRNSYHKLGGGKKYVLETIHDEPSFNRVIGAFYHYLFKRKDSRNPVYAAAVDLEFLVIRELCEQAVAKSDE